MAGKFEIIRLPLQGALLIRAFEFRDQRGLFLKFYEEPTLAECGIFEGFREEFMSVSCKNTVRGLHYLGGKCSEAKLITCLKGKAHDVIVDIRKSSPSFGRWHALRMSGDSPCTLYVPKGFAHGFLAMTDDTTVLYRTDSPYKPESQRGIIWNDPMLTIKWPLAGTPILSEADKKWPTFELAEKFD